MYRHQHEVSEEYKHPNACQEKFRLVARSSGPKVEAHGKNREDDDDQGLWQDEKLADRGPLLEPYLPWTAQFSPHSPSNELERNRFEEERVPVPQQEIEWKGHCQNES